MRQILLLGFSLILFKPVIAQKTSSVTKGDFFFSWGYSREWFTKSDIHFTGTDYDFTLSDLKATDRQSPFEWDPYFHLNKLTVPQYNVRIGYFLNDKYSITLGWDHMKYVMVQDQTATINGTIAAIDSNYNGSYTNQPIQLTPEFLTFEHTDGLNYANVELRRFDNVMKKPKLAINLVTGVGFGVLYPRTNVELMNMGRADQWHLSGYGASMVAGINATFFRHYFMQTELKGGFINMPDVLTTYNNADRAQQHFFFSQWNVTFGALFNVLHK
jgi:hypothetical protein